MFRVIGRPHTYVRQGEQGGWTFFDAQCNTTTNLLAMPHKTYKEAVAQVVDIMLKHEGEYFLGIEEGIERKSTEWIQYRPYPI